MQFLNYNILKLFVSFFELDAAGRYDDTPTG